MANWSDTYIAIESKDKAVLERIEEQLYAMRDETGVIYFGDLYPEKDYSSFEIDDSIRGRVREKDGMYRLNISGAGRYAAPLDFFREQIFEKHGLSGKAVDTSRDDDFFIKETYRAGVLESRVDTPYCSTEHALEYGSYELAEEEFEWVHDAIRTNPNFIHSEEFKAFRDVFVNDRIGWSEEEFNDYFNLHKKQLLFIVGNPATGKTTLADTLSTKGYGIIKSTTTRPPRNEEDHKWYRFVSPEEMGEMEIYLIEKNEYGGHLYGTSREDLFGIGTEHDRLVKVIEPKGLAEIRKHIHNTAIEYSYYPFVDSCVVLMNIDPVTAHENLKKEGYSPEEIAKRLGRENVLLDMLELDIKPDIIVSELNETTWSDVYTQANEFFLQKEIERSGAEHDFVITNDESISLDTAQQETPAPAP